MCVRHMYNNFKKEHPGLLETHAEIIRTNKLLEIWKIVFSFKPLKMSLAQIQIIQTLPMAITLTHRTSRVTADIEMGRTLVNGAEEGAVSCIGMGPKTVG